MQPYYNIVLLEPEIPQNTGNIGRICVGFNCHLHLIRPFGFELSDKNVKRAGLDYWQDLTISDYDSWEHFLPNIKDQMENVYLMTTKTKTSLYSKNFKIGFLKLLRSARERFASVSAIFYELSCHGRGAE